MVPSVLWWPPLNFVVTSIVFVWISHKVAEATGELTRWICGINPPNLPVMATSMDTGPSEISPGEDTQAQDSIAEFIPLSEHMEGTSSDAIDEGAEKLAMVSAEAQEEGVVEQSGSNFRTAERVDDTSASSSIRSLLERPLSLPIRIGCLLFALWAVNMAWPLGTSFM
jgi:N-acetylneuraminate 9-O-acetyltransferase